VRGANPLFKVLRGRTLCGPYFPFVIGMRGMHRFPGFDDDEDRHPTGFCWHWSSLLESVRLGVLAIPAEGKPDLAGLPSKRCGFVKQLLLGDQNLFGGDGSLS
jgi:hypothetical protein